MNCGSADEYFAVWQRLHRELEVKRAQAEPAYTNGRRRQRRKRGWGEFPSKRITQQPTTK